MNRSMPGLPVHHQLPESTQTHVHQVDNAIQPSHPLFSQEAGQVVSDSHLFQNFPQFAVIHTVKGFAAEIDLFLELFCFFNDSADVGNLTSGSSVFSKTSLNICKFMIYVLLKPGLENFEHYFTSM